MVERKQLDPVTIENAEIIFRNFSGLAGKFKPKGQRYFSVKLDDKTAEAMMGDGWNVRFLQPREGYGDEPQPILEVKVKYPAEGSRGSKPRVYLVTSRGKTLLDEDMLPIVDWADIETTDMIIRPYQYDVSGRTGISAYLKSIYIHVIEDPLELKYLDVPDSAQNSIMVKGDDEQEPPWEE